MATLKIIVLSHQRKEDGTYNVKIRLTHNRKSSYIATPFFVVKNQLNKDYSIKDDDTLDEVRAYMRKLRKELEKLGFKQDNFTSRELADYLINLDNSSINFIEFSENHLSKLTTEGRIGRARSIRATINSIKDFVKRDILSIHEITLKFLLFYEEYLRHERVIERKNQFNKIVTITKPPLKDSGISDYMSNIRSLFNAAIKEFNDEDKGVIKINHYPFNRYKIRSNRKKTNRSLSINDIRKIRDIEIPKGRALLARDVFILSFCLIGMNTVDLYNVDNINKDRISYYRSKTRGKRQDDAFISIKIEPEVRILIEKYKDSEGRKVFSFYKMYASSEIFNANVNIGLKQVAKLCDLDVKLSTYFVRHSWATIARNDCKIPKSDIQEALNHVGDMRVTDMYIRRDWGIIDEANRKVLDKLVAESMKGVEDKLTPAKDKE